MILGDSFLNAFINTNILFLLGFALFWLTSLVISRTKLRHAHSTQLRLLNSVFLIILFSPLLILGLTHVQSVFIGREVAANLSDVVVSYYLNGGFEMKATEFERLMSWRTSFESDVMGAGSWLALVVIGIFSLGCVIGLTRLVYSMHCLHKIVSESYGWRKFGRVHFCLSDRVLVPFSTRGLRRYYVVIPSGMLASNEELKVSIAHELQHLRQGDIEWEILLEALKPLFFLNPAYHAWKKRVEDLRELACDSQVLTRGRVSIKAYCDTLLNVCQQSLRRDRAFVVAVPKVTLVTADRSALRYGKASFLEKRITTLFDARKIPYARFIFVGMILPMFAVVMFAAMAIQKPSDWSQDRLMLSTVVNLERLEEINRLSTFGRVRN